MNVWSAVIPNVNGKPWVQLFPTLEEANGVTSHAQRAMYAQGCSMEERTAYIERHTIDNV